jgi:hypothetical protein
MTMTPQHADMMIPPSDIQRALENVLEKDIPMIAQGLRERRLFSETDYVCMDCVTIVLDPEKGCPACTTRRKNTEAKKSAFFAAMDAKREEQKTEDQRLRAEALSGLEHP